MKIFDEVLLALNTLTLKKLFATPSALKVS